MRHPAYRTTYVPCLSRRQLPALVFFQTFLVKHSCTKILLTLGSSSTLTYSDMMLE